MATTAKRQKIETTRNCQSTQNGASVPTTGIEIKKSPGHENETTPDSVDQEILLKQKRKSHGKPKGDPEEWLKDHHQYLEHVVCRLQTGRHTPGLDKSQRRRVNKSLAHFQLNEEGELMYVGNSRFQKVLYTEEEKDAAFRESHVGHPGAATTRNILKKHYYFKGIVEYITKKVAECEECSGKARSKKTTPQPLKLPQLNQPRQRAKMVGLDVIGSFERTERGCRHCMMMIDQYTKWVEFYPIPDNETDTIAKAVRKYIYSHGAPETILCNRGKRFISDLNMELLKMFSVQHMVTSAFIQNENHIMNSYRKAVKSCITEYIKTGRYDWEYQLDLLAHKLNTSKYGSARQTAFSMVYGADYLEPSEIQNSNRITQTVMWPQEPGGKESASHVVYHIPAEQSQSQTVNVVIQNYVHDGGEVETEEAILGLTHSSPHEQPSSHMQNTSYIVNHSAASSSQSSSPASQAQTLLLTNQDFLHGHGYC